MIQIGVNDDVKRGARRKAHNVRVWCISIRPRERIVAPEKYGDDDYYTSGANKVGVQSTMQVRNAKSKITMQWKMIVTFDTDSVRPIIADATRSHNYSRISITLPKAPPNGLFQGRLV